MRGESGLFGRHEMPPLQLHNDPGFFPCLDPRSGSGMTDKSKDKDSETLDSCFSPSVILAFPPLSSSTSLIEDPGLFVFFIREERTLDPRSGSGMTDKRKRRSD